MAILGSFYTNWNAEIGWVQKFIDQNPRGDRVSTQEHRFALLSI